jgi:hypothetical protein
MSAEGIDAEDLLLVLGESTGPQTRVRDGGILYGFGCSPEVSVGAGVAKARAPDLERSGARA